MRIKIIISESELQQCKCGGFKSLCEFHGRRKSKYRNDPQKAKVNQKNYMERKKKKLIAEMVKNLNLYAVMRSF